MPTLLSSRAWWLALALVSAVPTPGRPQGATSLGASAAPPDLPSLLADVEVEWRRRDEPGRLDQIRARLDQAERAAPDNYGVLWRQARLYFWLSDDPMLRDEEKSRLGKRAWDYGDRASAVYPVGVEGWFFAAVGMGNYSLGIGILKALGQGIEGKFRERLSRAERLNPRFYAGGIYNAWGRFYFKLPWPKYDAARSEEMFRKVLRVNPSNVRGRVYLGELYEKEGRLGEARAVVEEALALTPGAYDAPEERRSQAQARELLERWKR